MEHELSTLADVATEVQSAIARLSVQRDHVVQEIEAFLQQRGARHRHRFPHNWCDFASCTLAHVIARELNWKVDIACWEAEHEIRAHWWVRCGLVDIDITGAQFDDCPTPVLVQNGSRWHREKFRGCTTVPLSQRPRQNQEFESLLTALQVRVDEETAF